MDVTLTLTVNAGLCVELAGVHIWIDALHDTPIPGFSTMTAGQIDAVLGGGLPRPDAVICTHCHGDHYSPAPLLRAQTLWPETPFFLPERKLPRQITLNEAEEVYQIGAVTARFLRLPHEKEIYRDVPHYGVELRAGGRAVLLPADCEVASPALTPLLRGGETDVAVLDFPWLTLPRGRAFVARTLRPAHTAVCHLPLPADDPVGYRAAAEKAAALLPCPDVRLLTGFLQTEVF